LRSLPQQVVLDALLLQVKVLPLLSRLLLETALLSFVGTDVLVPESLAEAGVDLILNICDGLFELLDGGARPLQLAVFFGVLRLVVPEFSFRVVELLLLALEVLLKSNLFALLEPEALGRSRCKTRSARWSSASPPRPG
jgi:hypothetical protein